MSREFGSPELDRLRLQANVVLSLYVNAKFSTGVGCTQGSLREGAPDEVG